MNPALPMDSFDDSRKGGAKRPILYLAVSFSLGIIFSFHFNIRPFWAILFSACFAMLVLLLSKRRLPSHLSLYLAIFFLGAASYQNSVILPYDHISRFATEEPRKIFIKGVVATDPLTKETFYKQEKASFTVNANSYNEGNGWKNIEGLVNVDLYAGKGKTVSFGDELILEGLISRPASLKNPGLFNYSRYLEIKGVYAHLKVREDMVFEISGKGSGNHLKLAAYNFRHYIRDTLDKYLEAPYSDFLKAILIGVRSGFDDDIKEDFIKTGTVHILAISGLHVGLIAGAILAFFGLLRVPKRYNLIVTAIFLIFYSFVAGSNPPIIRAVIMFSMLVIGYLINRDSDLLNSLSLAALLILLWNPKEIFDPSFQLSFLSVASIILFAPKIDNLLMANTIKRDSVLKRTEAYLLKGISVSLAAWIGTWPIIASYFNIVSPIAVISNLIVIPALFLITVSSFIFFPLTIIPNVIAVMFGKYLSVLERTLFFINHYLALFPFSYFRIGAPSIELALLYYALIVILLLHYPIDLKGLKITKNMSVIFILLLFNMLVWKDNLNIARKYLKVTFLDVGHGDSAVIELPKKGSILIDGGSGGREGRFDVGKAVVAPYLWNKGIFTIDIVLVTHFHEDHLGGIIYILKNFNVGCVIDNGAIPDGNGIYDEYRRAIKEKGIRHVVAGDSDSIALSGETKIFILNPEKGAAPADSNENSIALKLADKNFSVLFCADITARPMERMLDSYGEFLESDIVKVPHHGGRLGSEDSAEKFFKIVSPKVSIISTERSGLYNIAAKKTFDSITYLNSKSYNTSDNGAIEIISDSTRRFNVVTTNKN